MIFLYNQHSILKACAYDIRIEVAKQLGTEYDNVRVQYRRTEDGGITPDVDVLPYEGMPPEQEILETIISVWSRLRIGLAKEMRGLNERQAQNEEAQAASEEEESGIIAPQKEGEEDSGEKAVSG